MKATTRIQRSHSQAPKLAAGLVAATVGVVLIAAIAGLVLLLAEPSGNAEAILGFTAAVSGLSAAATGSMSMALLFRWRSWREMPVWSRLYVGVLTTFVIGCSIASFVSRLAN